MKFHQRLQQLRRHKDCYLADISQETGLSVSYLSDIETGRTYPSLKTALKLAAFYGVSMPQLFEGVEFDELPETEVLPPVLDALRAELEIPWEMIRLMQEIDLLSRHKAESREDWAQIYYMLKALVG